MKKQIVHILLVSTILLCFCSCQIFVKTTCVQTKFLIRNLSEETIVIRTYIDNLHTPVTVTLDHKGIFEIYSYDDDIDINVFDNYKFKLSSQDGVLLRFWSKLDIPKDFETALNGCYASYFKDYGVRQLHDEKEWTSLIRYTDYDTFERSSAQDFIFDILPEDLIPISEIIKE